MMDGIVTFLNRAPLNVLCILLVGRWKSKVFCHTPFSFKMIQDFLCGYSMKKTCYISHFGVVQPCIYMPVSFGNLREESLEEIAARMWASGNSFGHSPNGCPTNSRPFAAAFSRGLSDRGGKAVPYEQRASENSLAEWDDWAASYSGSADLLESFNDAGLAASADFNGKRVLDIGGGTGRFAATIAAKAAQVTVADFSEGMLKEARGTLKDFPNVSFLLTDIEKEKPAEGPYDLITAVSVMHHISKVDFAVEHAIGIKIHLIGKRRDQDDADGE